MKRKTMKTAGELAVLIGAYVEGNGATELRSVASPERAGPHDLIYVEGPRHTERAQASAATCVIAPEGISFVEKTVLRSASPKLSFAKAAALLVERSPIATGIHATAVVAPLARLAPGVSVGAYAVIGEDVHIGEG